MTGHFGSWVAAIPRPVRIAARVGAFLLLGLACALAVLVAVGAEGDPVALWGYRALLVLVAAVGLEPRVRRLRDGAWERRHLWLEMFALLVLPYWGTLLNHQMATDFGCDRNGPHLLAVREMTGVIVGYGVALSAYVAARLRPHGYAAVVEAPLQGLLLFGVALVGMVAVHTVVWIFVGVALIGLGLPAAAPPLIVVLFALTLAKRPRRTSAGLPLLAASVPLAAVFAGLYGAAHALWLGTRWGVFRVVTQTTRGLFSQLPIPTFDCGDDHYLCTVAAQGSPWLVRPLRTGRRRGKPILVNRQLAVANAFEDLLHERWPRLGRALRSVYDRLGLPVSRWIRVRALANVTYLLMKPAEWVFFAALYLFDRKREARIARMYR